MWIIEIVVLSPNKFAPVLSLYLVLRFIESLYISWLNLSAKDLIKSLHILILHVGAN